MKMVSRILILVGAVAVLGSVVMPWVTVTGPLAGKLPFDLLGSGDLPLNKTVAGIDTKAWPVVAAVGGLVAVLALFGLARKLLLLLGLLTTLAGGGLLYYVLNVVDIETRGNALQPVAKAALESSAGAGPLLLLAGGLCILVGALVP